MLQLLAGEAYRTMELNLLLLVGEFEGEVCFCGMTKGTGRLGRAAEEKEEDE